jgi:hypothetical protein
MENTRIDRYRPLGRAGHHSGRQASILENPAKISNTLKQVQYT